ncbi:hypothetical protein Dxin01_01420 [Deinococcus xinjiangensis]|uniref:Uncharacterized protein n=1 Tax=Deinococcus xinjiangensis TaxID=457454 RepID=A0ABP9VEC7_9DEIO
MSPNASQGRGIYVLHLSPQEGHHLSSFVSDFVSALAHGWSGFFDASAQPAPAHLE